MIHRLAGDGSEKGIGAFCINWAFYSYGHLRVDTDGPNAYFATLPIKKICDSVQEKGIARVVSNAAGLTIALEVVEENIKVKL